MHIRLSTDREPPSPQQWQEWLSLLPAQHLLQAWAWGDLKASFGWQPLRIAVLDEDTPVAAAQLLFRPILGTPLTTAYVPKGPMLKHGSGAATPLLTTLHSACHRRHAVFLKLEPDWADDTEAHQWLQAHGFVPSEQTVQPRRTVIIDLLPDEDTILSQMKSKTRYNIRLAQRRDITVRQGNADDLPVFHRLLQATSERAGFGVHTLAYYAEAWRLFSPGSSVALLLAQHGDSPLAALMVFARGERAWYLYGASSDHERQRMPTYLLQWEAMRWARARGCRTYDLWGIPDLDADGIGSFAEAEEHGALSRGMGGLYRFKRGFGGQERRYVGAYDYVYNRPLYGLLTAAWRRLGRGA